MNACKKNGKCDYVDPNGVANLLDILHFINILTTFADWMALSKHKVFSYEIPLWLQRGWSF